MRHPINRRSLVPALLALATLAVPALAAAQGQPAEPGAQPETPAPTGESLRADARKALEEGKLEEACKLFQRSDELQPSEDVKFELAQCLEQSGKLDEAASVYDGVAKAGGARGEEAAERAKKLRERATKKPEGATAGAKAEAGAGKAEAGAGVGAGGKPGETPKVETAKPPETEGAGNPYSDFLDTRLTWTFGDDDLLHQTGQAIPLSPNVSIGDRKQYRLFFDNLNSRFGGRENLTHLVLYKKMPSYFDRLDTEASMVLRFDLGALSTNTNNVNRALYDAGSYIRLFLRTADDPKDEKTGFALTFWPLDTDRFRLGYLYDISWGGTNSSINQSIFPSIQGTAPGAKLSYDHERFNVFVGFKTAQIVQVEETLTPGTSEVETIRVAQTNFGVLGGGGVQIIDNLRFDLGGGYFQQGKFDLPDVLGQSVYTVGGSARIVVHDVDMPASQSIDFLLYRNDPNKPLQIFKPAKYTEGAITWNASVEGSVLAQNLKNFDVSGETILQPAKAVALQGNFQASYFRASLTGIYRDLPFVLRNVPSYVPFESLPSAEAAKVGDELFVALAADYHFAGPHLTPGIGAGVQFPATFHTDSIDLTGNTIGRTVVVREQGNLAILPVGKDAVPIFQARASLKWDVSKILSTLVWVQYVRDNNGTFVERDPSEGTVALRSFISPDFFGFGTSMQARF